MFFHYLKLDLEVDKIAQEDKNDVRLWQIQQQKLSILEEIQVCLTKSSVN